MTDEELPSITCPRCGRTSYHPVDIEQGYCVACNDWTRPHTRGWWNMVCWNGLSEAQQTRLLEWGNLPMGYRPEGECRRGAEVGIETVLDSAPGPRFYCRSCAVAYLEGLLLNPHISSASDV